MKKILLPISLLALSSYAQKIETVTCIFPSYANPWKSVTKEFKVSGDIANSDGAQWRVLTNNEYGLVISYSYADESRVGAYIFSIDRKSKKLIRNNAEFGTDNTPKFGECKFN